MYVAIGPFQLLPLLTVSQHSTDMFIAVSDLVV
ncbi:hypothetical protein PRUB_a6015 [Pseudoalteromonas rubra]|uniref:Uncharacterized protein n=1 Tax=Pseudoalteromonas rubra TaxID=43658 RepID=A0A8T0C4I4_9GAMM|nr:hypothetical protein PRUB_a6015 [Pseudoalteromonas rubra]